MGEANQVVAVLPSSDRALSRLDGHEDRRREGLPTVSTLLGPDAVAVRAWRRWCQQRQRTAAVISTPNRERLLAEWIRCWIEHGDAAADAMTYLARKLDATPQSTNERLSTKTRVELRLTLERAGLDDSRLDADRLCRWILEQIATGSQIKHDAVMRMFAESCSEDDWLASGVAAAINLLPPHAAPALLTVDQSDRSPLEFLGEAAKVVTELCSRVPRLTLAIATSPDCFARYVEVAPPSFAKAVLCESTIEVAGCTLDEIRRSVEARYGNNAGRLTPVFERLAEEGATTELVERLADAVNAAKSKSDARSAEELFLFELLEHSPDLSGLFQLNARPGFSFGGQPAELDLACLSLKIAVEIDGYHHFKTKTNYRRDRRKDVELQRRGYLVLRFLAEDIVPHMQTVRDTIRDAVRLRQPTTATELL